MGQKVVETQGRPSFYQFLPIFIRFALLVTNVGDILSFILEIVDEKAKNLLHCITVRCRPIIAAAYMPKPRRT
eukprot:182421-Amphidinium_carterae.1